MTPDDVQIYQTVMKDWCLELDDTEFENKTKLICLLSPNEDQIHIVKRCLPNSVVFVHSRQSWDLNTPYSGYMHENCFHITFAMNVFMYSPNPKLWFDNVLKVSKFLIIQDIIDRFRSSDSQLGRDGDTSRFSYLPNYKSEFENSFDISQYNVQKFHPYSGGINSYGKESKHFLGLIKSDTR